jgi:diaminopimelate decarboxylase
LNDYFTERILDVIHPSYDVNTEGHLTFAGADTVALAKKHGTPLYLIDENEIVRRCRIYRSAVKKYFSNESAIYYASKALSIKEIYQ